MAQKTNAVRILEQSKIPYELKEYPVDESDLTAATVAVKIDIPIEQVFKTLVVRGDRTGVILACLPGDMELDLKSLAAISGNKKAEVVPLKEVQPLTGYIRGGVSPVGTKKKYPTYVHKTVLDHSQISLSAGIRGCQMIIAPADFIKMTNAQCGLIAKLV